MHPFVEEVAAFCLKRELLRPGEHVLIAVSGGPDSVAVLESFLCLRERWRLRLSVAHFNHGIRGEAAEADARFVRRKAEGAELAFHEDRGNVLSLAGQAGWSLQEAARHLRYAFLDRVRRTIGADRVALGHNADDQAEELLLRLLRGVGPDGLKGMPARREAFIRPLLEHSREEILAFLRDAGAEYMEDASNREAVCLRNRVRLRALPVLEAMGPGIRRHLVSLSRLAAYDAEFFESELERVWSGLCRHESGGLVVLDRESLRRLPPALRSRAVLRALENVRGTSRGVRRRHVEDILLQANDGGSNGHVDLPGDACVETEYRRVVFLSGEPYKTPFEFSVEGPGESDLPAVKSRFRLLSRRAEENSSGPWVAALNESLLEFPLVLRSVRAGDRIPLSSGKGSKKIKDVFMDAKIPRWIRRAVPVLLCGEEIVWVAGVAVNPRFRAASGGGTLFAGLSGWVPEILDC